MVNIPPIYGDDWGLVLALFYPQCLSNSGSAQHQVIRASRCSSQLLCGSEKLTAPRPWPFTTCRAGEFVRFGSTCYLMRTSLYTHTRTYYIGIYIYVCVRVCVIYRLIHLLMYERTYVCMHEKCVYIKIYIYVSVCI
jgi:hypothetical protein